MQVPAVRVLLRFQPLRKSDAVQILPLQSQQFGCGKVTFRDKACVRHRDVAHGRKFIEVEIPVPCTLQRVLRSPQFLVLHLQFDFVHTKFVQHDLGRSRLKPWLRHPSELSFASLTQFRGVALCFLLV